MNLSITIWRSLTDPHGTRASMTWNDLAAKLATPLPRPTDAESPGIGGWSPATFRGDRRAKDRVEAVTALVLDLDAGAVSLDRVRLAFKETRCIVHSTRRYTPEVPRWRVVVATSRPMTPAEYAVVWTYQRDRLAVLGIALDEQTKDPSRFWFLPCAPLGGAYVSESAND